MTEEAKPAAKTKTAKASTSKKKPAATKTATKSQATPAKKPAAAGTSSEKSNSTKAGAKIQSGRLAGARNAIGVPVEAVRGAADRVGALVSPVTDRVGGSQVTALRSQVESVLRQAEKRSSAVLENKRLKNLGDRAEKIQSDLTKALGQVSSLRP